MKLPFLMIAGTQASELGSEATRLTQRCKN